MTKFESPEAIPIIKNDEMDKQELFTPINCSSLTEKENQIYQALDNQSYGAELSRKVGEKIVNSTDGLYHAHRDYCGVGIFYVDHKIEIGEVNDGRGPYPVFIRFDSSVAFAEWLSAQSDQSLSLYSRGAFNNQTITKIRLEYFLQQAYSPVWNAYCSYLSKIQNGQ